jgi:hypothetical protein
MSGHGAPVRSRQKIPNLIRDNGELHCKLVVFRAEIADHSNVILDKAPLRLALISIAEDIESCSAKMLHPCEQSEDLEYPRSENALPGMPGDGIAPSQ